MVQFALNLTKCPLYETYPKYRDLTTLVTAAGRLNRDSM